MALVDVSLNKAAMRRRLRSTKRSTQLRQAYVAYKLEFLPTLKLHYQRVTE